MNKQAQSVQSLQKRGAEINAKHSGIFNAKKNPNGSTSKKLYKVGHKRGK